MKRISMAGSDVAVTDERIANLVIEYAMQLGRFGTTDLVTMPVARNGRAEEATLLVGPASQIALTDNEDASLDAVQLAHVDGLLADLRSRIGSLTGQGHRTQDGDPLDEAAPSFLDFDAYGD